MAAPLIGLLMKLGTYAGVVSGAGLAFRGVEALSKNTPVEPVIAGAADIILTTIDPLDLSEHRKRRAQDGRPLGGNIAGPFFSSFGNQGSKPKPQFIRNEELSAKAKEADKRAAQAERAATAAEARAAEAEKLARAALQSGDGKKANGFRFKALQHRRWATLAKQTAARARDAATDNVDKALEIASAALEIAKQGSAPPASPQAGLADSGSSASAKSLFASIVDAINRTTSEPDYEDLSARIADGAPAPDAGSAQLQESAWSDFANGTAMSEDDDDDDDGDSPELDAIMQSVSGPKSEGAAPAAPSAAPSLLAAMLGAPDPEPTPVAGSDDEPEAEVGGPCCSSCALAPGAGACSGKSGFKAVPASMVHGHEHGSSVNRSGQNFLEAFTSGSFDDGEDDDDDDFDFGDVFGSIGGPDEDFRVDGRSLAPVSGSADSDAEE